MEYYIYSSFVGGFNKKDSIDKSTCSRNSVLFKRIAVSNNLIDSVLSNDKQLYTWRKSGKKSKKQARLDYIFIEGNMKNKIKRIRSFMWIQSDHLMYTISIIVSGKSERGRGFYRFNNSLLSDSVFNEKVIEILNKDERCSDLSINFDCKKAQIRGLAIKRSSELRKNRDKELNNLYKHASQYEHDPHNHTAQAKQDETLQKIKHIEESIEQCNFYIIPSKLI